MEGLSKITQENNIENPKIKKGVDFVFEQNTELFEIGTKEQYSEYLETIFPESNIVDIVWHGSPEGKIENFNENRQFISKGFFFSDSLEHADKFANWKDGQPVIHGNLLNIKKPLKEKFIPSLDIKETKPQVVERARNSGYDSLILDTVDLGFKINEFIVLNSDQIYILGSKNDLEGFKKFIENKKETYLKNPQNYNKKEKIVVDEDVLKKIYPDFYSRFNNERYDEKDNAFIYENGDLKIQIKLQDFSLDKYLDNEMLRDELRRRLTKGNCEIKDYFLMTDFQIKNKYSEFNLAINQKELFVIINKKKGNLGRYYSNALKLITLDSIPSTPVDLLSFFHELGHFNDIEIKSNNQLISKLRHENIINSNEENEEIIKKIKLKGERKAWAYAINKIKPFMEDLNISDDILHNFIHKVSLGSYS